MSLIEVQEIQQCTDAGSFQRGEDYFKQRKVLSLTVDDEAKDRLVLHGKSSGSKGEVYRQNIQLVKSGNKAYTVKGTCSCPVGRNCKHVVAACLTFRQRQLSEVDTDDDKLSRLAALIGTKSEGNEAVGEEFIVYVLKPRPQQHSLSVHFMVCRALARRGVTRGHQIRLQQFSSTAVVPKYAAKADIEIGKLLATIEGKHWNDIPLIGEPGYQALNKMLATKRCYWERVGGLEISPGERRPAELKLEPSDKRNMKLTIQIEPPADNILQIAPAMYLDLKLGTIGPMQGIAFTPHQWKLFNEMPLIPASQAKKLSVEISDALSSTAMTTTQRVEAVSVAAQPVPVLHVFEKNIGDDNFATFMRLRMRYDIYEIPPLPKNTVTTINSDERLINIRRALGFEDRALRRLVDEGFISSVADTGGDMEYFCSLSDGPIKSAERWQHFAQELMPVLKQEGWEIEYEQDFSLRFHDMGDWKAEVEEGNEWFDLRFDLDIGDRKVPLLPIISEILIAYEPSEMPAMLTMPIGKGEYINIPSERVRPVCEILYELHNQSLLNKKGALRLNRFDASRLSELEEKLEPELLWEGGEYLRELGENLRDFDGIKHVEVPKGLEVTLRDYQQQGLNWLGFLREYSFGGILADDMGLGKTVQTLAHLLKEKEQGRLTKPCLIIAPTSLMSNWRREAEKFAGGLRVLVLQGSERLRKFSKIPEHDLVLSTYPLLSRDCEKILAHEYYYLALDEAQNIKNPKSKAARTVREVKADHRLCLTGTPMENHLGELWAQFDFLMPGLLGNAQFFKRQFRTPIEKHENVARREHLVKRVAPFMLRRKKIDVIQELPEKTEI
ncbi:MAG: SNF2-related protein, partial [Gammaproteobacteria bacterium]|nr:SNF2-related protein [Gammaproteobacteria bacterium]